MTPLLVAALVIVSAHARSQQPGELVDFTVSAPPAAEALKIAAFDREIIGYRVDATHWAALVGIDLDTAPGRYRVGIDVVAGGSVLEHATYDLDVRAKQFPTRQLQVDPAFVTPPVTVEERIAREAKELAAIWTTSAAERYWSRPFTRPVPGAANSQFGTRSVFNGVPRAPHGGGDFLSGTGTPVFAPNAGRIVLARDLYFSGNTVIIDHGLGLFSLLAHLSEIDVHEGDLVEDGKVIGKVGATGRVTGPHLHWAVRANGARIDPLSVLALLGPKISPAVPDRPRLQPASKLELGEKRVMIGS
jgi:murein DD-endopeptidase MepM/ murein hydrolase activator NlpD